MRIYLSGLYDVPTLHDSAVYLSEVAQVDHVGRLKAPDHGLLGKVSPDFTLG